MNALETTIALITNPQLVDCLDCSKLRASDLGVPVRKPGLDMSKLGESDWGFLLSRQPTYQFE